MRIDPCAGRVSGIGKKRILFNVILPLTAPVIVATAIYYFIVAMEMFDYAALLGMPAETMAAMLRHPATESAFLSDIWLPEFKAARALPEFVGLIRSIGWHDYWRDHGMPDVCNGGEPELFCGQFVDSEGI